MKIAACFLLCFVGLAAALEMECPRPEWKQWRKYNTCYWFEDGDYLPQYKADERCRRYNGKLTKIDNKEENDWIFGNVIPQVKTGAFGGSSSHYYIGLKRDGDGWKWEVDGTTLDWGADNPWLPGEPNDYHNKENCVTLFEDNGQWNDVMCGDSFHYICEYQIPPA